MKGLIQVALAATLVVGATAQPHAHQHRHQHVKKHEHAVVEKRAAVTVTSVVPATTTVTEYVMDGHKVDAQQAEKGIKGGDFIVVGSTTPTFTPPPPPPPPSSTSSAASSSSTQAAQFFELKPSASAAPSSAPPAASSAAAGLNVPFPTGDDAPSCSALPTAWGAVPVSWLNTGGWASIQKPSNGFKPGIKIQSIETPTSGTCEPGMFCVPACPPGYVSTQWPDTSQGQTGQSVGGLWCDDSGKLRLTRSNATTICAPSAGGVQVKNKLPKQATICQTAYPGTEAMVIPTVVQPGGSSPLTNPDAKVSYFWEVNGELKATSGQFYVNPLGLGPEDACMWQNPKYPNTAGNWAAVNLGVGKDLHGITYIGLFANLPTSTAVLDYNVRITGDVTVECKMENGVYSGDTPTKGCTTAISHEGGTAIIEFYQ